MDYRQKLKEIQQRITGVSLPASPKQWKGDGVDHINIWPFSDSPVGRAIALDKISTWDHPFLGSFLTIEAVHILARAKTIDESYRKARPQDLRQLLSNNTGKFYARNQVRNLDAALLHCAYVRLLSEPKTVKMLIESTLPFDHYWREKLEEGKVPRYSRRDNHSWIVPGFNEIREAFKNWRQPNFKARMSDPDLPIYVDILKQFLGSQISEKEILEVQDSLDQWCVDKLAEVKEAVLNPKPETKPKAKKKRKPKAKPQASAETLSPEQVNEELKALLGTADTSPQQDTSSENEDAILKHNAEVLEQAREASYAILVQAGFIEPQEGVNLVPITETAFEFIERHTIDLAELTEDIAQEAKAAEQAPEPDKEA